MSSVPLCDFTVYVKQRVENVFSRIFENLAPGSCARELARSGIQGKVWKMVLSLLFSMSHKTKTLKIYAEKIVRDQAANPAKL